MRARSHGGGIPGGIPPSILLTGFSMPRRPFPPKCVQLASLLALPPSLRSELDRLLFEEGYRQAAVWLRERHGITASPSVLVRFFRSHLPRRFLTVESAKGRLAPDFLILDLTVCLGRRVLAKGRLPLTFCVLAADPSPAPASASDGSWPLPDLNLAPIAALDRSSEPAEAL